jgi:uncharacterized protein (TIGR02246 family)
MKTLVGFCLGALLAVPAFGQGTAKRHGYEADIFVVIQNYEHARNSPNASQIEALFTTDADQLVSSGEWRKGRRAIVSGTMASSRRTGGHRRIIVESIRLVAPGVAIVDGRYELTGLAGGTTRRMWSTFIMTRGPKGWRIAAIRNMLPAAPAPSK